MKFETFLKEYWYALELELGMLILSDRETQDEYNKKQYIEYVNANYSQAKADKLIDTFGKYIEKGGDLIIK